MSFLTLFQTTLVVLTVGVLWCPALPPLKQVGIWKIEKHCEIGWGGENILAW